MVQANVKEIGERITRLRGEQTQEELAAKLYITREKLSMWEQGRRMLKAPDIIDLSNHFKVSSDYLLFGIEPEMIDVNRDLGLSPETIRNLQNYYFSDSHDTNERVDQINKNFKALNTALSSSAFVSTIIQLFTIDKEEPGFSFRDRKWDEETKHYVCRLSPDMYVSALTAYLSVVITSLRKGEEMVPFYEPVKDEWRKAFTEHFGKFRKLGEQNGKES